MRKYKILEHVSQGLEKLHDMCVLHRDLKTLNILLDGEPGECEQCQHSGNWKICDFVRSCTRHSIRGPFDIDPSIAAKYVPNLKLLVPVLE